MGSLSVLVVTEHRDVREMLEEYLRARGLQVNGVDSVAAALAALGDAQVVLAELSPDHTDGLDLLAHLQGQGSDLPVVLMTANPTVGSAVTAFRAGAKDYLVMPFPSLSSVFEALHRATA